MISQNEIDQMVLNGIITKEQANKMISMQSSNMVTAPQPASASISAASQTPHSSISFATVLYYLGGFLIVFAISYFLGSEWEYIGDAGRIISSLLLILCFDGVGAYLSKTTYQGASSVLLLVGAVAVPLFIHSVERAVGWWPSVESISSGEFAYNNFLERVNTAWIILDVLTVLICLVIFYTFKRPILTLPVAHFFWFLLLDGTSFLTGTYKAFENIVLKSWISIIAGVALILWGILYHRRTSNTLGVWPWLYGLGIMLGSLITLRFNYTVGFLLNAEGGATSNLTLLYQCLILAYGLGTLLYGTSIRSKIFLSFGALAIFWFIQDISWSYFKDSLGFSLVLIVSGLLTIVFGVLVQKLYKKEFSTVVAQ